MSEYQIVFARSARKDLSRLDKAVVSRIFRKIEALSTEPRPSGSRKIQGADDMWRIRVGNYRVIYAVQDADRVVDIFNVRHRRDAYRFGG